MKMKVACIQSGTYEKTDTYESYMKKQYDLMEEVLRKEEPYLVVFPESMTAPYFCGMADDKWFALAEPTENSRTIKDMVAKAKEFGVHIVFTFFEKAREFGQDVYYNSLGIASPTRGLIGIYHKNHVPWVLTPSVIALEKYYFKPGNGFPVYRLDNGVTLGALICYDRAFPESWRVLSLQGAQLIVVSVCAWGFRHAFFVNELRTRAYENHVFVAAVNRAGDEELEGDANTKRHHFGNSVVVNPNGDVQHQLDSTPWTYLVDEINLDEIEAGVQATSWFRDRRPELYGIISANGCNFNYPDYPTANQQI